MTPIEPMTVKPVGKDGHRMASMAVAVAMLTSVPWAWMYRAELERTDVLLADATVRSARVSDVVIAYSNGARVYVEIGERK